MVLDPFINAMFDLIIVVLFAISAVLLKAIDSKGFLASVAVGFSILYGGGFSWFIIVATFFTLGVGFTWYKYGYKKKLGAAQEKGGARNWPNILANGGSAAFFSILELRFGGGIFAYLFLGSIVAAASDTVATEFGLLSKSLPRLITDLKKQVRPGTSGGVTLQGSFGAFLSSVVIGVIAILLRFPGSYFTIIFASIVSGLGGALFDSILGATLQRQGYCKVCLRETERLKHCGETTVRVSGLPGFDNNIVNFVATLFGSFISMLIFVFLR